jgi:hypothetical protein
MLEIRYNATFVLIFLATLTSQNFAWFAPKFMYFGDIYQQIKDFRNVGFSEFWDLSVGLDTF